MNNRIRELLSQAGVHYEVMPKDTVYEKFAKLIIKECAELVKDGVIEQQVRDRNTYTYTSVSAADTILEHFGVE